MALRIPPKTKQDARDSTEALQEQQSDTNKAAIAALTPASTLPEVIAALQTP